MSAGLLSQPAHGAGQRRRFVLLAVAVLALGPLPALLSAHATLASSPIDGVYRVSEAAQSGQGGGATGCWPTPMRKSLAPDSLNDNSAIYDVQITSANGSVAFSAPGSNVALLTLPVTTVPSTTSGAPPTYQIAQQNQPVNPSDVWFVEGSITPFGSNSEVSISWTYQQSPDGSGQCVTQMSGQLQSPAVQTGAGVDITTVLVGGVLVVTAIAVGGWVWRNRTKKPLTPPADRLAPKVPPQCRDIATRYDNENEILTSLAAAERELAQKLDRAETIHRNNIVKARMVINLQIIQTIGGMTTDLALALRPSSLRPAGVSWMGEQDTWRPPGSITTELSGRIQQAETLWHDLLGRFQSLGNEVETLKGTVAQAVEKTPAVVEAKTAWQIQLNRLGEMINDLPQATALRTEIEQMGPTIETATREAGAADAAVVAAQQAASEAESALHAARNQLPPEWYIAQNELGAAENNLNELTRNSNVEATLSPKEATAQSIVEKAQAQMASANKKSADQLAAIEKLQQDYTKAQARVTEAQEAAQKAGEKYMDLSNKRKVMDNTLNRLYSDMTPETVEQQGKIAADAERAVEQAQQQATAQVGRELVEKEAERERIANEASAAHELVNDLRAQAEREDTWNRQAGRVLGKGVKIVLTPITYPAGLVMEAWDWAFGSAQSPQEIVDVLVRGQTNIRILRTYLNEIDQRIFTQNQLVERLRSQVDACVNNATVTAPPPQPSVPAAGGTL